MNIRKGDIVQVKTQPFIQGVVVELQFYPDFDAHVIRFRWDGVIGHNPDDLRVIRRGAL